MLKPLCKTPGQGSAAFGRTARNRLLALFAPSKLPSDRGFDQKRPFFGIWLPSDEGFDHFRRAQGHRPKVLAFPAGVMTNETPFRSVRRAGRPKGVARSAVRRGGPCGPPLLMRSLPQLRLCGFLRNPLHGFQSEPFRRPARHRVQPAAEAKERAPKGSFRSRPRSQHSRQAD